MECKANASDLLRSCVELCRGAAGWFQDAFRFYMENIGFIILSLLSKFQDLIVIYKGYEAIWFMQPCSSV